MRSYWKKLFSVGHLSLTVSLVQASRETEQGGAELMSKKRGGQKRVSTCRKKKPFLETYASAAAPSSFALAA
jgi:hypothetical protein